MVINPVTVTLGRHEWEHIVRLCKQSATRLDPVRSKARPALEHYIGVIDYAIAKAAEEKGLSEGFRKYWERHQELPFGEAHSKWRSMSPLERSVYFVKEV